MHPSQANRPAKIATLKTDTIEIDHDVIVGFRKEAEKRCVSVSRLIKDLLGVIAADQLTAAILDD